MRARVGKQLGKLAQWGVIAALLAVLVALIIAAVTGHRCFLDVLNAAIKRQCVFHRFYAGTAETPPTWEVIPELGDLEDAFPAIQAEMLAVLKDRDRIPQMRDAYDNIFLYKGSGAPRRRNPLVRLASALIYGKDTEIFDKIGTPDWQTFNLVMFGQDVPHNAARCPTTVSLLRRVPGMQSALISIIAPGTYIPPHNDPAKGVIRYHLALKVPQDRERCFINVAGQNYHWEEGKGVLFDDVFDHWVLNDTDEDRVILFVDILRPLTGVAKALQGAANLANRYHPGVRRAIRESAVV
jgi:aspartyl/asparaginyl beta-hydroxylase (cupin superfamily)